jgi:hypothetical protein
LAIPSSGFVKSITLNIENILKNKTKTDNLLLPSKKTPNLATIIIAMSINANVAKVEIGL